MQLDKRATAYNYGILAEQYAAHHLEQLGYQILKRRYKCRYGELDLICQHQNTLLFVEVKARQDASHLPIILPKQVSRNCSAAGIFLSTHPQYQHYQLRFDYIVIHRNKVAYHLENAWEYVDSSMSW